MQKNLVLASIAFVVLLGVAYTFLWISGGQSSKEIFVKVKEGTFEITVENSGEVYAKNSVDVSGPTGLRSARVWQVKIANIVPEGSIVNEGDFVATLDKSEFIDKLKEYQIELDKASSQFTQIRLDTTQELRDAREKMVELQYTLEEQKLEMDLSKYEPPATIRKVEIAYEKAQRSYEQALENYQLKRRKGIAKMQEVGANLQKNQNKVDFLAGLIDQLVIKAPKDGMVIYRKSRRGEKIREGSTIDVWNPIVASLPDMAILNSRTYINEVDIRKVKKGQKVKIGLDAFPDKQLTGEVISVANVGEQKPNSDAKVFEVNIQIHEKDTLILPSMTTSNIIYADVIEKTLSVPLECVHNQGDSINYVFKKNSTSLIRQQVELGKTNENEAQILAGLDAEEEILISLPTKPEGYKLITLENAPSTSTKLAGQK